MKKLLTLFAVSLALSCTSVVTPGSTGSSTSGGGEGGATSASASSVTGSTTSTQASCDDPTVFLDIEGDGPVQHFDASCMPVGNLQWPGGPKPPPPPDPMEALVIEACHSVSDYHLSLFANPEMWPASGTLGNAGYQRGAVTYVSSSQGSIDVTSFGPVGGVIEGTFTVPVSAPDGDGGMMTLMLTGKFRVCRGPDIHPV